MANTVVVHVGPQDSDQKTSYNDDIQFDVDSPWDNKDTPDGAKIEVTGVPVQRMSQIARTLMTNCIRKQTRSKYTSIQKAWLKYCNDLRVDPMQQRTYFFLNFLAEGFQRNLKWGTLRSYVPALHKYLKYVDIFQVRRLLKGVFNLRPPVARYTVVWDVNSVLQFLSVMVVRDQNDLSMKLATLLMILSGNRVNMLTHFDITHMYINKTECTFTFGHVLKATRANFNSEPMTFRAYPDCPQLCPVGTIWEYLNLRSQLSNDPQFFITTKPTKGVYKGVTSDTIARWVKKMLGLCGIDSGKYTAHSCRAASTSAALFRGISIATIVKSASWSNVTTFKKFYLKEISSSYDLGKTNFGEEMLNKYVDSSINVE